MTLDDRVAAFRHLHDSGCFVMPNPWDVGSARALEQLGFPALATTSAGHAWTLGRADNGVTLEESLEHLMGRDPERVVRLAIKGMLPKGRLGRSMIGKLKIYAGPTHPHSAQQPKPFELISRERS